MCRESVIVKKNLKRVFIIYIIRWFAGYFTAPPLEIPDVHRSDDPDITLEFICLPLLCLVDSYQSIGGKPPYFSLLYWLANFTVNRLEHWILNVIQLLMIPFTRWSLPWSGLETLLPFRQSPAMLWLLLISSGRQNVLEGWSIHHVLGPERSSGPPGGNAKSGCYFRIRLFQVRCGLTWSINVSM